MTGPNDAASKPISTPGTNVAQKPVPVAKDNGMKKAGKKLKLESIDTGYDAHGKHTGLSTFRPESKGGIADHDNGSHSVEEQFSNTKLDSVARPGGQKTRGSVLETIEADTPSAVNRKDGDTTLQAFSPLNGDPRVSVTSNEVEDWDIDVKTPQNYWGKRSFDDSGTHTEIDNQRASETRKSHVSVDSFMEFLYENGFLLTDFGKFKYDPDTRAVYNEKGQPMNVHTGKAVDDLAQATKFRVIKGGTHLVEDAFSGIVSLVDSTESTASDIDLQPSEAREKHYRSLDWLEKHFIWMHEHTFWATLAWISGVGTIMNGLAHWYHGRKFDPYFASKNTPITGAPETRGPAENGQFFQEKQHDRSQSLRHALNAVFGVRHQYTKDNLDSWRKANVDGVSIETGSENVREKLETDLGRGKIEKYVWQPEKSEFSDEAANGRGGSILSDAEEDLKLSDADFALVGIDKTSRVTGRTNRDWVAFRKDLSKPEGEQWTLLDASSFIFDSKKQFQLKISPTDYIEDRLAEKHRFSNITGFTVMYPETTHYAEDAQDVSATAQSKNDEAADSENRLFENLLDLGTIAKVPRQGAPIESNGSASGSDAITRQDGLSPNDDTSEHGNGEYVSDGQAVSLIEDEREQEKQYHWPESLRYAINTVLSEEASHSLEAFSERAFNLLRTDYAISKDGEPTASDVAQMLHYAMVDRNIVGYGWPKNPIEESERKSLNYEQLLNRIDEEPNFEGADFALVGIDTTSHETGETKREWVAFGRDDNTEDWQWKLLDGSQSASDPNGNSLTNVSPTHYIANRFTENNSVDDTTGFAIVFPYDAVEEDLYTIPEDNDVSFSNGDPIIRQEAPTPESMKREIVDLNASLKTSIAKQKQEFRRVFDDDNELANLVTRREETERNMNDHASNVLDNWPPQQIISLDGDFRRLAEGYNKLVELAGQLRNKREDLVRSHAEKQDSHDGTNESSREKMRCVKSMLDAVGQDQRRYETIMNDLRSLQN